MAKVTTLYPEDERRPSRDRWPKFAKQSMADTRQLAEDGAKTARRAIRRFRETGDTKFLELGVMEALYCFTEQRRILDPFRESDDRVPRFDHDEEA